MRDIYFMDTFAGMGGLRIGVENALRGKGYNPICVQTSEVKSAALKTLAHVYPDEEFPYTDITQVDTGEIPHIDGLIGGFPCFPAGTQITTDKGLKNIEDIEVGDNVLTHTNTYKTVLHTMNRVSEGMYHLHTRGSHHTQVTGEHPYYVRYFSEVTFDVGSSKWVEVKDFTGKEYVGFAINRRRRNPFKLTKKQVRQLGRLYAGNEQELGLLTLSDELLEVVNTTYQDTLPGFVLDLPKGLLAAFYQSYQDELQHTQSITTANTSRKAYSLAQVILKLYQVGYTVTYQPYDGLWSVDYSSENNTNWVYLEGQVWQKIDRLGYDANQREAVYNFEVEEDNTYIANNVIVHNCQSFSYAGKRLGLDDTRGTLFYELARIMKDKQPQWAIFENVRGLLGHDNGKTFEVILNTFYSLGYHVSFQVMDAKYYGTASSRPRVFIVCHRDTEVQLNIPVQQEIPFSVHKENHAPVDSDYTKQLLKHFTPEYLKGKRVTDKTKSRNIIHSWEFEARGPVTSRQVGIMEYLRDEYSNGKKTKGASYAQLENRFGNVKQELDDLVDKRYAQYKEKEGEYRVLVGELSGQFTKFINPNKPLPTLVATSLPYMGIVEDTGVRQVTVEECARALGFPDDYTFPDDLSDNLAYDLLGNTVSPPVVKLIMDEVLKQTEVLRPLQLVTEEG